MNRDPASEAQHRAADPAASTWLSANAGSGKTKVLIDRVARLLLAGVSPQHILCLTYTKAAATEMQNRLFRRLGAWAMMPDDALRAALLDLGQEKALNSQSMAQARQLFARAIESPGGLRIQTIHSFCATLLRRFPLEAGVSPAFQEMDDRAAKIMRENIIEEMAESLAPETVRAVAQHHSGADFLDLMAAIAGHSAGFAHTLDLGAAKHLFGVSSNHTEDALCAEVFLGDEAEMVAQVLPYLRAGSPQDQGDAKKFAEVDFGNLSCATLAQLEGYLLYKSGEKALTPNSDSHPTDATRRKMPDALLTRLADFMARVAAARPARIALQAAQKTAALHEFAAAFLPLYARAKAARGLLDFDDLIERAIHLLTDRSVAAWVLYRLDGGIDHILVDEAQDTSPKQWRVIDLLTEEFTSGHGSAKTPRTLFVVGDKKQSIYSFQGADIAMFDAQRAEFHSRFAAVNIPLEPRELLHSFRSSPAILGLVDSLFGTRFPRAMGDKVSHLAHFDTLPGRVDLWPVIAPAEKADKINPTETAAQIAAQSHVWELAQRVAGFIDRLLKSGAQIPTKDGARLADAGDILILVQTRGAVFHNIIRACKQLALPIAGADRLRLVAEMAVRDITALLQFLATPEDDLSLAAALRSPLVGLDEAQLFDLAQGRAGFLWEVLRASPHQRALDLLTDLRDAADFLRPYDLIERLLSRHDGRRRLIARLGPEAEEGIDEMLAQALAYEQAEVPSLTGFLGWMDADDVTVKRQIDSTGGLIRVMTVHGAKGLEAPIVILPETADRNPQDRDEIVELDGGALVWRVNKEERPPAMASRAERAAMARSDESLRLLYVALTRAQSWLIVAAAGKSTKADAWHNLVAQGMQAVGAVVQKGGTLRHEIGVWPENSVATAQAPVTAVTLPTWTQIRAAPAQRPVQPFAPSRLSGAKTIGGEADAGALDYGSAVHLLLEHLPSFPQSDWPIHAARMAGINATAALAEAVSVLTAPHLQHVFSSPFAEVPLTAMLEKGPMQGVIDRLVIAPDRILAVDFKTNAVVPKTAAEVPGGLLAQMGAYLEALHLIYPGRTIDMAILWTGTAELMLLDHDMMSEALRSAAIS